ncbi:MAG: sialate O-acetylesterase [Planctomycetales bacterium]|nr:sialate O-acetylesterase [Planctomycetales bacterium]
MRQLLFAFTMLLSASPQCFAEIRTSAVFGESMVLQRDKPIHVWGWTEPDRSVEVSIAGNRETVKSDRVGRFDVKLPALAAGGPHKLTIESGGESLTFGDVLVGEVWVCSGQSNMQWAVGQANDADLESLSANFPQLRLITVPQVGTQEAQQTFNGKWEACTPESVKQFSAVGYFFGRQLQQTLDVPVGLIDNSWGGSAAEAWVNRDVLKSSGQYEELLARWRETEATYDHDAETAKFKTRLDDWKETGKGARPQPPRNPLTGQHRPANLYNGVLRPIIGYTIRGVVWYQGETNAGRAYQYRDLFPTMIQNWRDEWGQDDFSFYWVQLADYLKEADGPTESSWAELREAQTMTMSKLPNTGEAVILNLGESSDIHPKNKQDVGKRLARWALAKDYGYAIEYQSPTYKAMTKKDGSIEVEFDHVGGGLDTFDVPALLGFTIAGADKKFVVADAKITGKSTIEVSAEGVTDPVAVRYAWADNPVCNVQSKEGLPMTPFRTDDWKGVTADAK